MAPKRKREDATASTRKQPARAAQSKSAATSSVSAPKTTGSSKTSVTQKAPAKKALTKKSKPAKKPAPKKPTKPSTKKNSKEGEAKDATPKESDLNTANSEPVEDDNSPKFTVFNKLPLELRLRIWGFAAPDPCVVVQCDSFNPIVRYRYVRDGGKVPGVLHACRESRNEFLETDDASNDVTLARRRRAHPVYKLYFIDDRRTRRKTGPVFFSCDVDTFWPLNHKVGDRDSHSFSGTALLDIAKNLKHLALLWQFISWSDWDWWNARFPKLESLTVLQWDKRWDPRSKKYLNIDCPPEIDGQLCMIGMPEHQKAYLQALMRRSKELQDKFEEQKLDQKFPLVKLRFENQFIVNEGIVLPQAPQDPIDDLE